MSKIHRALEALRQGTPRISDSVPLAEIVGDPSASIRVTAGGSDVSKSDFLGQVRTVKIQPAPEDPILPFDGQDQRAAEQYRIIRTKITHHRNRPRILTITSGGVGDGKTVSAINIAGALALKEGFSVLLADIDFRRSSLSAKLGIDSSPGLANVLRGVSALQEAVVRLEQLPNLYVLPIGEEASDATELLESDRYLFVRAQFARLFDYTIIDGPPAHVVADSELLEATSDGVIVIVRPDHTNRSRCLDILGSMPKEKLIGVVVNSVSDWFLLRSLGHYYAYDEYSSRPKTRVGRGPK